MLRITSSLMRPIDAYQGGMAAGDGRNLHCWGRRKLLRYQRYACWTRVTLV